MEPLALGSDGQRKKVEHGVVRRRIDIIAEFAVDLAERQTEIADVVDRTLFHVGEHQRLATPAIPGTRRKDARVVGLLEDPIGKTSCVEW